MSLGPLVSMLLAMERHVCRGGADGFALPGAEEHYPPDLRLEPIRLELDVSVRIAERELQVAVKTRVRARVGGVRTLAFDGIDFRDLEASLEGGGEHAYDGRVLTLAWSAPFREGEEREVSLRYRVVEPVTGVFFSAPDAARPDAPTFAVTDHETERARYWLASVDHPSVRPELEIRIHAEARLTALSNGAEVGREDHADGTRTTRFSQTEGCPSYLVCFAVGDFARWDGGEHDGVPIAAFAPRPFTEEHVKRTWGRTPEMLAFFEERLGVRYPFAKYYQFAAEGIGGAMENISLVSWDDRFVLDETLEKEERHLVDIINVHEMAHSWFGDRVVCRDYAHAWLKEGWATYMESCWLEAKEGPDSMAFDLEAHADAYFSEVDERYRRPIVTRRYSSSFDLFDGHLYPGAALRIHMLRMELGDEVFWAAVRDYLERHAGEVVETDDFRRALEARSGRSLGRFFEQWFYRPGFPDLEVSFRHDADAGDGTFEVRQKQADEKTGEGAFDIELELAFGDGASMERRTMKVSAARAVASFPMAKPPQVIRVDPEGRVLHRLRFDPGIDRLLRQLDALDARGRIEAGRLLAEHGGRQGAEAIGERFEREPHWGVRVKWTEALGRARSEAALEALLSIATGHSDPRSLAPVFRALGDYRDPRVAPVLEARLEAGLPYRATEAAYEALGAQRERAPFDRLLAAARTPGFGGFAQAGALRGLGATRRVEALEPLLSALARGGAPERVRPAAAEGLGALARGLDKRPRERAIEALVDALRERAPKVPLAAARALGNAKASESAEALEALAKRLPRQEEVKVRRVLAGLREGPPEPALKGELDGLADEVRRLRGRVEDLEAKLRAKGAS